MNLQCSLPIGLVEFGVFVAFALGTLAHVRASIEGGTACIIVGALAWIALLIGPRVRSDGATLCDLLFGNAYVVAPAGVVAGGIAAIALGLVLRHVRPKK